MAQRNVKELVERDNREFTNIFSNLETLYVYSNMLYLPLDSTTLSNGLSLFIAIVVRKWFILYKRSELLSPYTSATLIKGGHYQQEAKGLRSLIKQINTSDIHLHSSLS